MSLLEHGPNFDHRIDVGAGRGMPLHGRIRRIREQRAERPHPRGLAGRILRVRAGAVERRAGMIEPDLFGRGGRGDHGRGGKPVFAPG